MFTGHAGQQIKYWIFFSKCFIFIKCNKKKKKNKTIIQTIKIKHLVKKENIWNKLNK